MEDARIHDVCGDVCELRRSNSCLKNLYADRTLKENGYWGWPRCRSDCASVFLIAKLWLSQKSHQGVHNKLNKLPNCLRMGHTKYLYIDCAECGSSAWENHDDNLRVSFQSASLDLEWNSSSLQFYILFVTAVSTLRP
jgi:hypothetical protein